MRQRLRQAGLVSVTLGAFGCGEPSGPARVRPEDLFARDTVPADSLKGEGWRKFLKAQELHRAWVPPAASPWRPYYKPTLVSAVAAVESAARPVRTAAAGPAELEAAGFAFPDAAVFIDLPGEQSVIWAMALQRRGLQPVLAINNWPHQFGLIRLERPLGALIYYADEMSRAAAAPGARPAFILEHGRLAQKGLDPGSAKFDNRYFHAATDFPAIGVLQAQRIGNIVYVNPRGTAAGSEEDDLNEYFSGLAAAGISFTYVKPGNGAFELAQVKPVSRQTIFTPANVAAYASTPAGRYTHRPYYHYHHWHTNYWSRSSGAWGSGSSGGGSSGVSG